MRSYLDTGRRILLICAEIRANRLNSGQFRPNFRAESPALARINILWLRTQSNKPFELTSLARRFSISNLLYNITIFSCLIQPILSLSFCKTELIRNFVRFQFFVR